ncbi:Grx4 family monothiol glutaredoxin [Immundisolibacter sp.]|uniref:Grx4 family monothiol glutaredoxin n=1 Tax=Immundisolibacter sp. TaxID=1934948 RepID=UPI000ECD44A3|nr:Grx4 family monothiol glutaredoxin [Gammaproteobacteria bacterium]
MDVLEKIDRFVNAVPVVLFMKGDRRFPQCGFSGKAVQMLDACGAEYETVNVLADDSVRQGIKAYSQWPTIPQLYIHGEFIGGSDIMQTLYENGDLQELLESVKG